MLNGKLAASRRLRLSPDVQTVTLQSRGPGETGFTPYIFQAQEHPDSQEELILAGASVGERWKIMSFYIGAQGVVPKESDQWTDSTGQYTIKSIDVQQARGVYRCRGIFSGA